MKIRIQGDSIRLRLTRPEVGRILAGQPVVEATHLPGATLRFELSAMIGLPRGPIDAWFAGGRLTVAIDPAAAAAWADPEHVGFVEEVDAGNGHRLTVRIEKDFACLDRAEFEPDAYPNPKACAAV